MQMNRSILTYTGVLFSPLEPRVEDVCIFDIAHHLSNICRYTGAVQKFYCVSQHSIYVSKYCDPDYALEGLLHDATEAYLNDIASPVKHAPEFAFYRDAEKRLDKVIREAFKLKAPHPSIKTADERIYHTEFRDLMPDHPERHKWYPDAKPYNFEIEPWTPEYAEREFLLRFQKLRASRIKVLRELMAI